MPEGEYRARLKLWVIDEGNGKLVHRAVTGYRPTPAQIAHVRAQYVYSVGPGSQVLAGRTDTDHAVPYPAGPTAIGNLLPNDRTWHNGHTLRQLSVSIDDSGAVKWTSVLGQSRTVTPTTTARMSPHPTTQVGQQMSRAAMNRHRSSCPRSGHLAARCTIVDVLTRQTRAERSAVKVPLDAVAELLTL